MLFINNFNIVVYAFMTILVPAGLIFSNIIIYVDLLFLLI